MKSQFRYRKFRRRWSRKKETTVFHRFSSIISMLLLLIVSVPQPVTANTPHYKKNNEPLTYSEAAKAASNFPATNSGSYHIEEDQGSFNIPLINNREENRLVPIFILIVVLWFTVSFVFRSIMRMINEAKRGIKFLFSLLIMAFLISIYYAPTETGFTIRRGIDYIIHAFTFIGNLIGRIIEQLS